MEKEIIDKTYKISFCGIVSDISFFFVVKFIFYFEVAFFSLLFLSSKALASTPLTTSLDSSNQIQEISSPLLSPPSNSKNSQKALESSYFKVPRQFLFNIDVGDEDSSIIAQINLGKLYILEEAASCYKERNKIFISFLQFVKAVGFPIKIDDDLSGASGWFIEEKRLFVMNFNSGILLANGKRFSFGPDTARVVGNEIFLSIDLLQKIFPLKISFDPLEQLIEVVSLEPLPVELAMERSKKWEDYTTNAAINEEKEDKKISTIKSPYMAASSPIVDMRYNQGFKKLPSGKYDSTTNFNALFGGDLLYLNHQLFLNFNSTQVSSARITSGRKDAQGELLGPLKATEFQIGDVTSPQTALAARGGQIGKGAMVSNLPEEFVSGFDQILIRGNMQAGWDAELYRNDQLILFQKVSQNGVYEFQNVPLVSGPNIIRLVFYGPFGQKREELRKYYSSEGLIKKGKFYYRVSGSKENQTVFNFDKKSNPNYQNLPKDKENRYFSQFLYGLTKNNSLIADFIKIPNQDDGKPSNYGSLGLRSSFFGIYTDFNLTRQLENNAKATQISAQTSFFEQSLTLKNQHFDKNFVSEQQQKNTDPLINLANFRIDGVLGKVDSGSLMNSLTLNRFDYFSKNYRLDAQDELSFNVGSKLTINQILRHVFDSRSEGANRVNRTGGNLFNYRFSRSILFRSAINYNFTPKFTLSQASNTIDYNFANASMLNFSHNYQFPQAGKSGSTNYVTSYSRQFKGFIGSLSGSFNDDDKSFGLNLNLSMSVGYDMRYRTGIISGTPIANNGIISARIFLDKNNNGIFDKNELGLEKVGILIDNQPSTDKSNKDGTLMITQISARNPVKIKVNNDDISDPSLVVKKPPFKILVHPGSITNIDFPIVSSNEITGTVKVLKEEDKITLASSVRLELIDIDGKLVKETVSAFDGYYSFDLVPVGAYKIRVSPAQMARLGMTSKQSEKNIEVSDSSEVLEANFILQMKSQENSEEKSDKKPENSRQEISLPFNKSVDNSSSKATSDSNSNQKTTQKPLSKEEILQQKLLEISEVDSNKAAKEGEKLSSQNLKNSNKSSIKKPAKKSKKPDLQKNQNAKQHSQNKNLKNNRKANSKTGSKAIKLKSDRPKKGKTKLEKAESKKLNSKTSPVKLSNKINQ